MKDLKEKMYMTPTVKVVSFKVEDGFVSPYSVNQPTTENDGMSERMNYDEGNRNLGWDWHVQ